MIRPVTTMAGNGLLQKPPLHQQDESGDEDQRQHQFHRENPRKGLPRKPPRDGVQPEPMLIDAEINGHGSQGPDRRAEQIRAQERKRQDSQIGHQAIPAPLQHGIRGH
jgi:hypothetical protein